MFYSLPSYHHFKPYKYNFVFRYDIEGFISHSSNRDVQYLTSIGLWICINLKNNSAAPLHMCIYIHFKPIICLFQTIFFIRLSCNSKNRRSLKIRHNPWLPVLFLRVLCIWSQGTIRFQTVRQICWYI